MIKNQQESFYTAVGKALTAARKNVNMSIAQLSKLSGEQNKTIRHIEAGKVCSLHHAVWMRGILNIDVSSIIKGIEGNHEQKAISRIDSLI